MLRRLAGLALLLAAVRGRAEESALRATQLDLCREVVQRECRGLDRTIDPDVESVYFMTRIEGATGEAYVFHVWRFEGEEVLKVKLPVRGSVYRTWSAKVVKGLPGHWRAEVLDPVGRSLGAVEFVVSQPRS
jgi:DUF2914 family protein